MRYELESSAALVFFDGSVKPLLDVVNSVRSKRPDVVVMRHEITPKADGPPGDFQIARKTSPGIVFNNKDHGESACTAVLQTSAGTAAPLTAFTGSNVVGLVWTLKLTAAGLSPVRPQLLALMDFDLEDGHAICLAAESSSGAA